MQASARYGVAGTGYIPQGVVTERGPKLTQQVNKIRAKSKGTCRWISAGKSSEGQIRKAAIRSDAREGRAG